MCSLAELDSITKEMVECYHTYYGKNIVGIYLYGSYARGDFDNQSDIDITAVVKGDRLDLQNKLKVSSTQHCFGPSDNTCKALVQ